MDPASVLVSRSAELPDRVAAVGACFRQDPEAAVRLAETIAADSGEHPILRAKAIWWIVRSARGDALVHAEPWMGWARWDDQWNDPAMQPPDFARWMVQSSWLAAATSLAEDGFLKKLAVFDAAMAVAERGNSPLPPDELASCLRDLFPVGQEPPEPKPTTLDEIRAWRPMLSAIEPEESGRSK